MEKTMKIFGTENFQLLAESRSDVSLRLTELYAKKAKQRKQEEP